ncbi:hypothetical protein GOODEAATRI_020910, partial [Goodea atripinnis]
VVYRQTWHGRTTILETNKTSIELQVSFGEDYVIEITALTEGGDGTSSGPIHIPKMSSKFQRLCSLELIRGGNRQRSNGIEAYCVTNPLEGLILYMNFSIARTRSLEIAITVFE